MKQEGRAWEKGFFTLRNCVLTRLESQIFSSSPLLNGGFFPVHERCLLEGGIPEGGESVTALPLPGQGTVRLCGPAQQTAMQTFSASSLSGREPHNLELILWVRPSDTI